MRFGFWHFMTVLVLAIACTGNRDTPRDTIVSQPTRPIIVNEDGVITALSIEELLEDSEFIDCYDGDTCKINIPGIPDVLGKKMGLRIWGVDTPEMKGKDRCRKEKRLAILAKQMTNQAVFNAKRIEFSEVKRGKFYRLVARLRIDGAYLDETLIAAGLGVPYFGKTKSKDWCAP